jgi:purine nucleosidase
VSEKIRVLLDTDIGSDIDDAVALSYLLRQERCDLLGITTVTGDVAQRAACADVLCREMGRGDIPIHTGASAPLLLGPGQPTVPHYQAIRDRQHRLDYPPNTAVEFLRQTIRRYPGEVVLLSIGPFTNIALLFALDPEIPALLKRFVSMAGVFLPPAIVKSPAEWNVLVDPIASWIVYNRPYPFQQPHLSVGLEVTTRCTMRSPEVAKKFIAKPLDVARQMADVWFGQSHDFMTFHDPLAAALLFTPDLCGYARGGITVPVADEPAGQTRFVPDENGMHAIANSVLADRFFEHYFSVCR